MQKYYPGNIPKYYSTKYQTVGCAIFPPFYIDSQISVQRKLKKIDQLIFRNAKEIYFNEKFSILEQIFGYQYRRKNRTAFR
jgi:hypothetical protein